MGSTILLADKSITIQKIVELTFADENFVIKCVSDGQAALDQLSEIHPNLVLADISLPVKNGYEVCEAIRNNADFEELANVPVILLAGIYETMDDERARLVEERAKAVGANEVLSKPFDPQLLTAKVKQFVSPQPPVQPVAAPTSENIFSEPMSFSSTSGNSIDMEAPPDDGERTMMLPRSELAEENVFADSPSLEDKAKTTVDADLEPVEYSTYESNATDEKAFDTLDEPPTIILPPAEEPFGDVFEEQSAPQWTAAASEEESPFGVPEPPAPVVEEEAPPAMHAAEVQAEESVIEPEPIALEEATSTSSFEEVYEDTWPGVIPVGPPPVEELFESEAGALPVENRAELLQEPALSDTDVAAELEDPAAPAPAIQTSRTVEITDDLVDRIAERVVAKLSERMVSEIVWQVVPDLAEKMIRREIEKLHAGEE